MSHYDELRHIEYMKEISANPTTPLDIADYKRKWMSRVHQAVEVHSDLDIVAKDWCRRNLKRHAWSMSTWTGVYEHTFHFENQDDAYDFRKEFIAQ
jgi:hypothetical protein